MNSSGCFYPECIFLFFDFLHFLGRSKEVYILKDFEPRQQKIAIIKSCKSRYISK